MTNHTERPGEINSLPCPLYQHGFTGHCEVCIQRVDCILLSIFNKVECLEKNNRKAGLRANPVSTTMNKRATNFKR